MNSYKRLMPRGLMQEISWAPVFQAWGYNNRTLMCRLPMNRRCLEVRTADSAVNFYLGAALVLAAGLDGIRRELKPADPVNTDTYKISEQDLAALGVRQAAVDAGRGGQPRSRSSEFVQKVLGSELHASYAQLQAGGVAGVQHRRRRVGAGQVPAAVVTAPAGATGTE